MTKLEELKAVYHTADEAADDAYEAAYAANQDADDAYIAYKAELEKTQEEKTND